MTIKTIYINGRYLSQRMTGVQRFANEAVKALDAFLTSNNIQKSFVLLIPPNFIKIPEFSSIKVKVVGKRTGVAWEQLELPSFCKDGMLINLANAGPLVIKNQLIVIHDLAVYAIPEAYSLLFRLWYKLSFFIFIKRNVHIATVSNFSRSEFKKFLNIPSENIHLLVEGHEHMSNVASDHAILTKFSLVDKPFILAVSSMTPNKNFSIVAKAIEQMETTEFDFVVAGGVNPSVFASENVNLPKSVKYLGYISDEELKCLYEHASCFVFPSLYEGFGLPPVEAMACGCPVIASNRASIPEVCGNAAEYFEPTSVLDLKNKLLKVLRDEKLRESMNSKGLIRVQSYSWKVLAKEFYFLINKLN